MKNKENEQEKEKKSDIDRSEESKWKKEIKRYTLLLIFFRIRNCEYL